MPVVHIYKFQNKSERNKRNSFVFFLNLLTEEESKLFVQISNKEQDIKALIFTEANNLCLYCQQYLISLATQ